MGSTATGNAVVQIDVEFSLGIVNRTQLTYASGIMSVFNGEWAFARHLIRF